MTDVGEHSFRILPEKNTNDYNELMKNCDYMMVGNESRLS